jgi:hypothetical protein
MKRARFAEEQIIGVLKGALGGRQDCRSRAQARHIRSNAVNRRSTLDADPPAYCRPNDMVGLMSGSRGDPAIPLCRRPMPWVKAVVDEKNTIATLLRSWLCAPLQRASAVQSRLPFLYGKDLSRNDIPDSWTELAAPNWALQDRPNHDFARNDTRFYCGFR